MQNLSEDKLFVFPNIEKNFQEKWSDKPDILIDKNGKKYKGRKKLNIPSSFRMCMIMPSGCGKTNIVKNILHHQNPSFDIMYVLHGDEETTEYNDCNVTLLEKVPDEDFFNHPFHKGKKILFVADDFKFEKKVNESYLRMCRIFTYISSHKNVCAIVCLQDGFANFPTKIKRNCNFFITCKQTDLKYQNSLASMFGLEVHQFKKLMSHMTEKYDSLWIDKTNDTPYPFRKNGIISISWASS